MVYIYTIYIHIYVSFFDNFATGHTITLKRNSKNCLNSIKLQAERDKLFYENQVKMMSMIEDIQETLLRVTSLMDMKKKIQIDSFFPIKNDSQLQRFLDKSDGDFQLRREEFENLLYCYVTKTLKLKRPFETSLLAMLFHRDYISSHRWPGPW